MLLPVADTTEVGSGYRRRILRSGLAGDPAPVPLVHLARREPPDEPVTVDDQRLTVAGDPLEGSIER